ncbi:uncharacterized protein [Arachis hypogaea]|uniref:uncharacterized protein n=1 Tax=Arachis hypogaea TaxID=3818 RepID=UPI003B20C184
MANKKDKALMSSISMRDIIYEQEEQIELDLCQSQLVSSIKTSRGLKGENIKVLGEETLAAIPPPHQHIQHLNPPFANQNTQPIRKRKKEGKKEGKRGRGPLRRRRGRGRKLSAPCHHISSSPPCCFAVHEESPLLPIRHKPPSLVNDEERESREKEWVATPSRRRHPPRTAAEPAEQEPIATVRTSIAVREASMSVAVELISERKRVAGEREKCCTAVPYCSATATPCRHRSCHRRFSPPRGSLVYVAASVTGLIIELWITVLVVAGLPFKKRRN